MDEPNGGAESGIGVAGFSMAAETGAMGIISVADARANDTIGKHDSGTGRIDIASSNRCEIGPGSKNRVSSQLSGAAPYSMHHSKRLQAK